MIHLAKSCVGEKVNSVFVARGDMRGHLISLYCVSCHVEKTKSVSKWVYYRF